MSYNISLHYVRNNENKWIPRTFYRISPTKENIAISAEPISQVNNLVYKDGCYWNLLLETEGEITNNSFPCVCDTNEKVHYFYPDRLNLQCKTKDKFEEDMKDLTLELTTNIDDCELIGIYPVRIPKNQNILQFIDILINSSKYIHKISAIEINPHGPDWD